jgi:Zn finger protein HypA/HybF involved in hydrogenase expression
VLRVFYSADGPAATRREAIAEFEILTRRDYKCRVCGERESHVWWPMRCHYCDTDNAQVFDPAL